MARSERVELRWTPELLARVDEARGDASRNVFVERALEAALGGLDDARTASALGRSQFESAEAAPSSAPPRPSAQIPGVRSAREFVKPFVDLQKKGKS